MSSSHHRPTLFLLSLLSLAAVITVFSVVAPIRDASAMGQAPSTCDNVYGGTITSFLIAYPSGGLDALALPNSSFAMPSVNNTYTVTFVIHTANTSDSSTNPGNSLPGDTWYSTSAPGYGNGVCVPGAGPNEDITVSMVVSAPPIAGHTSAPVGAEWYTLAPGAGAPIPNTAVTVQYSVVWPLLGTTSSSGSTSTTATSASTTSTPPSPTTSALDVSTASSANSPMAGYYIALWQNGVQVQSCFSACSFTVNDGQTYQVTASSYRSETFSHWQDGATGVETVNVPVRAPAFSSLPHTIHDKLDARQPSSERAKVGR